MPLIKESLIRGMDQPTTPHPTLGSRRGDNIMVDLVDLYLILPRGDRSYYALLMSS